MDLSILVVYCITISTRGLHTRGYIVLTEGYLSDLKVQNICFFLISFPNYNGL